MAVADDLVTAALAIVQGALGSGVRVVERAVPTVMEQDTLPMVCLSVADSRREPATAEDDLAWFGFYTLSVVLVRPKGGAKPDLSNREWAEEVSRPLSDFVEWESAGFAAVDDVTPLPRPAIDAGQLTKGYSYTPLAFEVRTQEPR